MIQMQVVIVMMTATVMKIEISTSDSHDENTATPSQAARQDWHFVTYENGHRHQSSSDVPAGIRRFNVQKMQTTILLSSSISNSRMKFFLR